LLQLQIEGIGALLALDELPLSARILSERRRSDE
jgi:hypothetical protein